MQLLGFVIFLIVSHWGAMAIFTLTTYHAYFWKALPLLIGYGGIVGWALFALNMHGFFLWQLVCATIWLFVVGNRQKRTLSSMLALTTSEDESRLLAESGMNTLIYYTLSCVAYLLSFAVVYLWLYNR